MIRLAFWLVSAYIVGYVCLLAICAIINLVASLRD
jgi:hypothetical protein